jgi:cyclophilin family peptidyl-prolyl cis-trans isomerase
VPVLDGENVVFGRVLEGLETIGAISTVSRQPARFPRFCSPRYIAPFSPWLTMADHG